MFRTRLLLPAALLFLPLTAFTQSPNTGALRGSVVDPSGAPLPGVTLTIEDAQHHALRTVRTNTQGDFAAEALPAAQPITKRHKAPEAFAAA